MPRLLLLLVVTGITACTFTTATSGVVGSVEFAGQSYPIRAASGDPSVWQVLVNGQPVHCRKPTETDWYWSLRNYLNAQDLLNDLP